MFPLDSRTARPCATLFYRRLLNHCSATRKSVYQPGQNSSILAMVAGLDIMYQGDLIASETFNTFDTYIIVESFI